MKVHYSIDTYKNIKNPVITVGTFDGVHIGHQTIIKRINKIAENCQGESVLLTFDPHPRKVILNDNSSLKLINTIDEKIKSSIPLTYTEDKGDTLDCLCETCTKGCPSRDVPLNGR